MNLPLSVFASQTSVSECCWSFKSLFSHTHILFALNHRISCHEIHIFNLLYSHIDLKKQLYFAAILLRNVKNGLGKKKKKKITRWQKEFGFFFCFPSDRLSALDWFLVILFLSDQTLWCEIKSKHNKQFFGITPSALKSNPSPPLVDDSPWPFINVAHLDCHSEKNQIILYLSRLSLDLFFQANVVVVFFLICCHEWRYQKKDISIWSVATKSLSVFCFFVSIGGGSSTRLTLARLFISAPTCDGRAPLCREKNKTKTFWFVWG